MDINFSNHFTSFINSKDSNYNHTRNISLSPKFQKHNSNFASLLNISSFSQALRNRWNDNKNIGESFEIKGTLSRKNSKEYVNSTRGKWDNLLNKSADNIRPLKHYFVKDPYKVNTTRSQPSSMNTSFELADFGRACKRKTDYPEIKKSTAVGSIGSFLSNIPTYSMRSKKVGDNNYNIHTNIFSPEFRLKEFIPKRVKIPVNLTKINHQNNFAGLPSNNKTTSLNNNYKMNIQRINQTYANIAAKKSNQGTQAVKYTKKVFNQSNASTIFSTDASTTKCSSRKTYYNNDNYKKFFTKNFAD